MSGGPQKKPAAVPPASGVVGAYFTQHAAQQQQARGLQPGMNFAANVMGSQTYSSAQLGM